jgi:hypothetical protein
VFYTLLLDKDKSVPVDPAKTFSLPGEEICKYRTGYRYLAWAEMRNGNAAEDEFGCAWAGEGCFVWEV